MSKAKIDIIDCKTCRFCSIAVKVGKPMPPNQKFFCTVNRRILISRYNGSSQYITGIEKAKTCPNYSPNE